MIRMTLIAVATLATIAVAIPAAAQAGAPVRTLGPSDLGPSLGSSDAVSNDAAAIDEPKAAPKRCGSPAKPVEAAPIHISRCGKRPKTS